MGAERSGGGTKQSGFSGVAADSAGNVYAAGGQGGTNMHTYGPGVTATGTGVDNVLLVKYHE